MKKKVLILELIIAMFVAGILVDKLLLINDNINGGFNDLNKVKHENMLSMMLEQNAETGDYSLEKRSSWPTKEDGYVFNSTLSKCENGSQLHWEDENNVIVMTGNTSDKCYVYFDIYVYHEHCNDNTLACHVAKQYTGIQGANNLYYHDSTLENGANDNSYRYAGSSDTTNNFVCFGSDESTCPDDNLYRIIGVFGDQVKLIKWDYATSDVLGTATSSTSSGGFSSYKGSLATIDRYYFINLTGQALIAAGNAWGNSDLNKILNNYLSYIEKSYENKIAITTWKVGGNTNKNVVESAMNVVYQNEIILPTENKTYNTKIGLMYISDYGYASGPTYWTYPGYSSSGASYDYRAATGENWMYMGIGEWTMTRISESSAVTYVSGSGYIYETLTYEMYSNNVIVPIMSSAVRPVFYLESSVNYVSGSGTKTNPIIIN